jgi:predicted HNH restriction endonuclease
MQKCSNCGELKVISAFYRRDIKNNIYHKQCKSCLSEKQKNWRIKNADIVRAKNKKYRQENKELVKERKRQEYLKHRDKYRENAKKHYEEFKKKHGYTLSKLLREERDFGGKKNEALKRDGYACRLCGSKQMILVHHIDKTGRSVENNHNNNLDNLITLCRKCHINIHREDLLKGRRDIEQ